MKHSVRNPVLAVLLAVLMILTLSVPVFAYNREGYDMSAANQRYANQLLRTGNVTISRSNNPMVDYNFRSTKNDSLHGSVYKDGTVKGTGYAPGQVQGRSFTSHTR